MKRILITLCLLLNAGLIFGQTESETFRSKILQDTTLGKAGIEHLVLNNSFPGLFKYTDNSLVYGFIGNDYQRLRIKFISIKQSEVANSYSVYGKSMVKGNICEFHGVLNIKAIRKYNVTSFGEDEKYKNAGLRGQFLIIGDYWFDENKKQKSGGVFKGVFATRFYIDKNGNIKYDDIDTVSDSFTNNQFVGTWTQYGSNTPKRANWGDFRIPNSGDLDIGAGEFSPGDKYLKYGWQGLRDMSDQRSPNAKKAKQIEEAKWWK